MRRASPERTIDREVGVCLDLADQLDLVAEYSKLAEHRMMNGELVWNVTVKAHYFLHMCKQAADLNPRFAWVYQDEDFVGRISRIASSVAEGGPTRLGKGLVIKYLRLMYIRIKSRILQNHAHLFMNDADDDVDEEGGDDA